MEAHAHAIIVIRNGKGEFLQYFDERWQSLLFPNCKIISEHNEDIILHALKEKYGLNMKNAQILYRTEKVHTKYSVSAGKMKKYHHYFYTVDIEDLPIDDRFVWLTLEEMKENKRIKEVNGDIVKYVQELI